jgi:hypothetical protein
MASRCGTTRYINEFQRLRQRAGLRRICMKGLRNTSVSLMLASGIPGMLSGGGWRGGRNVGGGIIFQLIDRYFWPSHRHSTRPFRFDQKERIDGAPSPTIAW